MRGASRRENSFVVRHLPDNTYPTKRFRELPRSKESISNPILGPQVSRLSSIVQYTDILFTILRVQTENYLSWTHVRKATGYLHDLVSKCWSYQKPGKIGMRPACHSWVVQYSHGADVGASRQPSSRALKFTTKSVVNDCRSKSYSGLTRNISQSAWHMICKCIGRTWQTAMPGRVASVRIR